MTTKHEILIKNGFIDLPEAGKVVHIGGPLKVGNEDRSRDFVALATIVANMAYFGYAPNVKAMERLTKMSWTQLYTVWDDFIKPALDVVSGASKKMDNFVVYKNFPKEVLAMSQAQYWFSQICMYVGFPNELFTQPEEERKPLRDDLKLKVLQLAPEDVFYVISSQLVGNKARWTDDQRDHAKFLVLDGLGDSNLHLTITDFGFKENGIELIAHCAAALGDRFSVTIPDATDVLRLASVLSGGDAGLRTKVKFSSFKRPVRKFLVNLLENSKNLEDDLAMRADTWKKLLMRLHPGDFANATHVQNAYNTLYTDDYSTYNSKVEQLLLAIRPDVPKNAKKAKKASSKTAMAERLNQLGVVGKKTDTTVAVVPVEPMLQLVDLLSQRPGVFVRRFHEAGAAVGWNAILVDAFLSVADKLTTSQLVKLDQYLRSINSRKQLMAAPKGNWSKVQVIANEKNKIPTEVVVKVRSHLQGLVALRVGKAFPNGVKLDLQTLDIKLQTNDQELAPYGRGTAFDIPENVKFIRSASYWANGKTHTWNTWFDNGWNFFDEDWVPQGACCWSEPSFPTSMRRYWETPKKMANSAAIFSGDPTNSKDLQGRACQMIDLYLDKLADAGVRYAVWGILAFSRIEFSEYDVMGTLQWGENAESGKLYEPARAQMVFPLKGQSMVKYVAYIDVKERKLVYVDAGLPSSTHSAASNGGKLSQLMPAYLEYLDSLPCVADLFAGVKEGETPILYSDADIQIDGGAAYVFRPENSANHFEQIDITKLLA